MPQIRIRTISVFISMLISMVISLTSLSADQIIAVNGDRVSGRIVRKDAKAITIKSDSFGEVTMAWDKVQSVSTDAPINVVLSDGQTVQATLAARDGKVELETGGTRREAALSEVTALRDTTEQRAYERLQYPTWADLWAGSASLGLAGTIGNAETRTLTVGLAAARVTRADKTTIYLNAIEASAQFDDQSRATAKAIRGGWGYSRNITSRMFVNGFNDYEYDRFQNLDLRFVLGGGLGVIAWRGERGRLDLVAGGAYNRESFSPPAPRPSFSRNSAEAYTGDDFTYKLNSITLLYQNLRFFPNLSNTGEYRMNFDFGTTTRLARWITWTAAVSDRYLSNPVPGRQKNDFLYTTGIGVSFSR